ncbi:hypothetical protein CLOM_g19040, partial [Closterium sp. NIES-68]
HPSPSSGADNTTTVAITAVANPDGSESAAAVAAAAAATATVPPKKEPRHWPAAMGESVASQERLRLAAVQHYRDLHKKKKEQMLANLPARSLGVELE